MKNTSQTPSAVGKSANPLFRSQRYCTKGIYYTLSPDLMFFLWAMIEEARNFTKLDYLQIFNLEAKTAVLQKITHHQEQPEYCHEWTALCERPVNAKIYVIDDGAYSTMLLAHEY